MTSRIIALVLFVLIITGEVMCIVKALRCDWEAPYKAEAVYTISALTGVGCVVGYLNIKDGPIVGLVPDSND